MTIAVLFAIVSLFVLFTQARLAVTSLGAVALGIILSACATQPVEGEGVKADVSVDWSVFGQVVVLPARKERFSKAFLTLKRLQAREEVEAEKAESLAKLQESLARIKAKAEEIEIKRLHQAALKAKAPIYQSPMPVAAVAQNADMWGQLRKLAQDRAAEHAAARKGFVTDSHDFVLVCGEWVRA